jgi:hypothetical protein
MKGKWKIEKCNEASWSIGAKVNGVSVLAPGSTGGSPVGFGGPPKQSCDLKFMPAGHRHPQASYLPTTREAVARRFSLSG